MLEQAWKYLRMHPVLYVLITILIPFGTASIVSLLISSDREIIYETSLVSHCGLSNVPDKDCVGLYHITLGNTGTRAESMLLTWPFDLSGWQRGHNILNIAADSPRANDPVVDCKMMESATACTIDQFAPGAMLIMDWTCYACGGMDLEKLEEMPVNLQSSATIAYGDPRVTILFRRLQALLQYLY